VIAAILLVSLIPVLLALALSIKLSSPGPILFRQQRVCKCGRFFWMYKFRTMFHDSDPSVHREYTRALIAGSAKSYGKLYKLTNDQRVTRVGRILRKLSLDEIPQLFNVLKGEMSLVGPRPPVPYEVEMYGPREQLRLTVEPGITDSGK
jgi:lipopolysaccharide/colanic/teichoic acid biosynthesis glycosyltransferase